ncbi:hypothetical protein BO78DRAFT_415974 [Aspergillus sclerotiicarbonarius CBS 121057]|uniref:Uncharacterized protein n=1 Tax=Aspergillus sclerotiicarbonarius (strain CBS 121057 / IBT 28362) TaxID=1448318 RepID=A0A319EFV1_ASPSB|nr:hypothetical protein BO78DRAFT_415974 [Aspergillus sclerotiicarbonarius CBS 121057]
MLQIANRPFSLGTELVSYLASKLDEENIPYVLWGKVCLRIFGIGMIPCLENIPKRNESQQAMGMPRQPIVREECLALGEFNDTLEFIIEDEDMDRTMDLLRRLGYREQADYRTPCRFSNKEERYVSPCMIPDKCFHTAIQAKWKHQGHQYDGHLEIGQLLWWQQTPACLTLADAGIPA